LWYSLAVTNRLEMAETVARAELIAEEFDLIRTAQRSLIAEQTTLFRTIDENRKVLEDKLRVLDQETRTSLLNQDKQQNDLTDQLLVEVDVLARSMESAHQEFSRGSNEWLLEEILQLINLANERLLLVGDLSLAIRALKIAEDRIADLSDPALLAVRRQLVSDISVLGNIPIADINGAVLNLSMLMQTIPALPLAGEARSTLPSQASRKADEGVGDFTDVTGVGDAILGVGARLAKDFGTLVRIRNVKKTQAPSLAPELEFHIYESVRSPLNVAQLALLRRLPDVYDTSLNHAKVALMEGFDREAQQVIEVRDAIEDLRLIEVRSAYPDISKAREMLRDIVQRRSDND